MPVDGARQRVPIERIAAELYAGEAIIIDLRAGTYFSLVGAAADAWALLAAGATVPEAGAALADRYGVDPVTASADVAQLVAVLQQADLVEPRPDGDAPQEVALAPPTEPYAPLALVTYTDMQDLLALDPPMPGLSGMPWEGAQD